MFLHLRASSNQISKPVCEEERKKEERKLTRTWSFTLRHRQGFSLAARRGERTSAINQKEPRYQELDTQRVSNNATNGNAGTGNELSAAKFILGGTNSPNEGGIALATTVCHIISKYDENCCLLHVYIRIQAAGVSRRLKNERKISVRSIATHNVPQLTTKEGTAL